MNKALSSPAVELDDESIKLKSLTTLFFGGWRTLQIQNLPKYLKQNFYSFFTLTFFSN